MTQRGREDRGGRYRGKWRWKRMKRIGRDIGGKMNEGQRKRIGEKIEKSERERENGEKTDIIYRGDIRERDREEMAS